MTIHDEKNQQSIIRLLLADSTSSLLLGISIIEKSSPIPDLCLRALTMVAYLGKAYRQTHEGKAHQFLSDNLSPEQLKLFQQEILFFDYARFRFRPKGSWHEPNSQFKQLQKAYEDQHNTYFYLASFKPDYFSKLYGLVATRLKEDKEYNWEALQYYEYALQLSPNDVRLQYSRNMLQLKLGYLTGHSLPEMSTIEALISPFQLPNLKAQLITISCNFLSDLQAYKTAVKWYEKGIELFPNESSLYNNLAYLIAKYLGNFAKAKKIADQYQELFKGDTSFYDTLAFIELHGFNRIRESKRLYEKCLLLDRKSHCAYTGLGDILFKQEQYEEAYQQYKKGMWHEDKFTSRRKIDVIEKMQKIIRCLEKIPNMFPTELLDYKKKLKKLIR